MLSICRWTCLGTGCRCCSSALRAKVAAHYSKILMCASTSFTFQWPPTDIPQYGAPQSFLDASVQRVGPIRGVVLDSHSDDCFLRPTSPGWLGSG